MFSLKLRKKERPPETRLKACRPCTQANLPSATAKSHCCETLLQALWAWGAISGHEPAIPFFPQERNKEIPFYWKKKSASNKPHPPPRPRLQVLLDSLLLKLFRPVSLSLRWRPWYRVYEASIKPRGVGMDKNKRHAKPAQGLHAAWISTLNLTDDYHYYTAWKGRALRWEPDTQDAGTDDCLRTLVWPQASHWNLGLAA